MLEHAEAVTFLRYGPREPNPIPNPYLVLVEPYIGRRIFPLHRPGVRHRRFLCTNSSHGSSQRVQGAWVAWRH